MRRINEENFLEDSALPLERYQSLDHKRQKHDLGSGLAMMTRNMSFT